MPKTDLSKRLIEALLLSMNAAQQRRLHDVVAQGGAMTKTAVAELSALAPLIDDSDNNQPRLRSDVVALLAEQNAYGCHNSHIVDQIVLALRRGDHDPALQLLCASGGALVAATIGLKGATRIEQAIPDKVKAEHLSFALLQVFNAFKRGEPAQADQLLEEISKQHAIPGLADCSETDDPELLCVLFLRAVYSSERIADKLLEKLFRIVSALPSEAPLAKGVLFNASVDMLCRNHQRPMAYAAAQRSVVHYDAAGQSGLGFYIRLYLTILALQQGDIGGAFSQIDIAETTLERSKVRDHNDQFLLNNLKLIARYEAGDAEGLLDHIDHNEGAIPFGELWPAIAEPILSYGRIALSAKRSPAAALLWVRRWRLHEQRSTQLSDLINLQEAAVLQDMGRWQHADELLAMVQNKTHPDYRLATLASKLDRNPSSESLARQISNAAKCERNSLRQSAILMLMQAESAIGRKNEREALRKVQELSYALGDKWLQGFWSEQAPQLQCLMNSRAFRDELIRLPVIRRKIEDAVQAGPARVPNGLTRQEYRILLLLAEAQTNKAIAQRLGISPATVKYHLGNLFEKSGVRKRKEVVDQAIDAGWL